jgi:hypothetical protein
MAQLLQLILSCHLYLFMKSAIRLGARASARFSAGHSGSSGIVLCSCGLFEVKRRKRRDPAHAHRYDFRSGMVVSGRE